MYTKAIIKVAATYNAVMEKLLECQRLNVEEDNYGLDMYWICAEKNGHLLSTNENGWVSNFINDDGDDNGCEMENLSQIAAKFTELVILNEIDTNTIYIAK